MRDTPPDAVHPRAVVHRVAAGAERVWVQLVQHGRTHDDVIT